MDVEARILEFKLERLACGFIPIWNNGSGQGGAVTVDVVSIKRNGKLCATNYPEQEKKADVVVSDDRWFLKDE